MEIFPLIYADGWYPEEHDGFSSFRWMAKEAVCFLKDYNLSGKKYLRIIAGHSFQEKGMPILEVFANGQKIGERKIGPVFSYYAFAFGETGDIKFDFKLDRTFEAPDDTRELGIMVRRIEVLSPPDIETFLEGWHEWEYDELFPFRWMSKKARVFLPSKKLEDSKYISFHIYSEYANFTQRLNLSLGGESICEIPLLHKWNYYSFSLPPSSNALKEEREGEKEGEGNELTLSLNKVFPEKFHSEDKRELGVRISQIEFHNNDDVHQNFLFFHKNALLNYREMLEGKSKLESYPLNLGVDLYGKCNMKPPCVYCLWDSMKKLEGEHVNAVVDEKTLNSYGPFFRSARTLVNCSFGEPLLHPRFQETLDFCQKNKKIVELSTNGQSFTKRTIDALLGKPIFLYISLDAASKETYAKIRNDRWDSILPNLMYLGKERKKRGNLPKIFMVFMPMKVNKHELEDYFRLCQRIEADSLVLRPLLYLWNPKIEADRGGYHFDYKNELLSLEETEELFKKCNEYSKKYGVPVANQFSFGIFPEPDSRKERGIYTEAPRF